MKKWQTTIDEILKGYKDSLKVLLPNLELFNIDYSRKNHGEEWEEISTVLFENLVLKSILFSQNEPFLDFPDYDLLPKNCSNNSLIIVKKLDFLDNERIKVFNSFEFKKIKGNLKVFTLYYEYLKLDLTKPIQKGKIEIDNSFFYGSILLKNRKRKNIEKLEVNI